METVLKMDIFFFVATAAVLLVTAIIVIASFYALKIIRDIKNISHDARIISERIRDESNNIITDVKKIRVKTVDAMEKGGIKSAKLLRAAIALLPKSKKRRDKK